MLPGFHIEAIRLDDVGDDIRQRFVARHCFQNLLACNRMGTSPAAGVNRDGIHNPSVNSRLKTAKSNVGGLMVAAARRTTGPVNRERIHAGAHFVMQGLGERDGTALRFDEREIAIVRSDARDQSAYKRRGAR